MLIDFDDELVQNPTIANLWSGHYCTIFGGEFSKGRRGEQCGYPDNYVICSNDILMFMSTFDSSLILSIVLEF